MLNTIGFLAAAKAGPSPVIPHPAEIIVGFIAFGLLFLIIRSRAVPRFEKAYKDRTEAIEGGLERAETAQREAAEALKTYKAQLADARGEATKLREEARAEGSVILEQMRTAAQEEATRITASARASIEAERQVAFNSLLNEVGGLATELASRIVGESLDDAARASRVVERFLADVEKSQ